MYHRRRLASCLSPQEVNHKNFQTDLGAPWKMVTKILTCPKSIPPARICHATKRCHFTNQTRHSSHLAYLCDEDPILLHQMVIVVTACKELPNLPSECFRDSTSHQRGQSFWSDAQIQMPGTEEGEACYTWWISVHFTHSHLALGRPGLSPLARSCMHRNIC